MAADLSIHVLEEPATLEDYKVFCSNTLGSKYFNLSGGSYTSSYTSPPWKRIAETPQVWIGEVSWLKASLVGDSEAYVPGPVMKIHELIGEEFPVVDDELIDRLCEALRLENSTGYVITEEKPVREFLEAHRGKPLFTVSW